jgi:uncharacterized protein DUF6292
MASSTRNPRPPATNLAQRNRSGQRADPTIPTQRARAVQPRAGENPQGVPRLAGPAPPDPSRASGSDDLDHRMLVIGYLSTVTGQLDQRDFFVRELHTHEPSSSTLWGSLTLDATPKSNWAPARLHWEQDSGWSATLLPRSGDERLAVSRYLPGQLVPAPVTVAHFAAALRADPDTGWARATFRPPRRVDRRYLILQLARFTMPAP